MRIGRLDLPSGISGDMLLGAALDAGASWEAMTGAVHAACGDRVELRHREVMRAGLRGMRVEVLVDGSLVEEGGGPLGEFLPPASTATAAPRTESSLRHYTDIVARLQRAPLDPEVQRLSLEVFRVLAEAESRVHGTPVESVHFHELGSWDAVADIVGAVAAVHSLRLDRLEHGTVALGGGVARTEHGSVPVPAPATLEILARRPVRAQEGAGELTTPTGAALVSVLAVPAVGSTAGRPDRTGYGAGRHDPPHVANLARLWILESESRASAAQVAVIEAALDDCTPEEGGDLLQRLLEAGARDATLSPLIMKKGRPGFLVRVVADPEEGPVFADLLVRESTTLGARWRVEERRELPRRVDRVRLPDGEVRVKVALLPDGEERPHAEYEDLARLARARGEPLARVRREVERIWESTRR